MIPQETLREISVPCRNRDTKEEKTCTVLAYSYSHAIEILEDILDLNWQVGWGSM